MGTESEPGHTICGGAEAAQTDAAGRPPRVALLGLAPSLAAAVWEALAEVGYEAVVVPLDRLAVAAVARADVDVMVLDGHAYLNTRAILDDLRAEPAVRALPVVVLGPVVALGAIPPATPELAGGAASSGALDPTIALAQVLAAIERLPPVPRRSAGDRE